MKKLILLILFLCVAVSAHASKVVTPAPPGTGTWVPLEGGATLEGEYIFESIQSDEITVARPIETTEVNAIIAISEDDTTINTIGNWSSSNVLAYVGAWAGDVELNTTYRFTDLNIPQGATILTAQLKLIAASARDNKPAWQIGFVDTIEAVSPVDIGTFPEQDTIYDYTNQDTGIINESTEGEELYFPTTSTGTTFVEALQSFVDNPSWDDSSAVMAVISSTAPTVVFRIDIHHHGSTEGASVYPTLIITYSGTTYEPVATVSEAETTAPRIVLPDTLYGVAGDTLQLFVRGMIEAQDPYALPFFMEYAVTGGSDTVGRAFPRYFELELDADDVSTEDFTITILDNDYDELATKRVDLVVSNTTGVITPATNKNFLCLGDSLTASGQWPTEAYRRLTQAGGTPTGLSKANITFVGDKQMAAHTTQAYTGTSGWIWNNYIGGDTRDAYEVLDPGNTQDKSIVGLIWTDDVGGTWAVEYVDATNEKIKIHRSSGATAFPATGTLVSGGETDIVYTSSEATTASPLWNVGDDEFNFTAWVTRNVAGGEKLDAVYVLLGWNGITTRNETADMTDVRTFLDQLQEDAPDVLVRIIGIQVPSPFGGIGTRYDSESAYGQYYALLRTANNLNIAYQDLANEAAYSSWVEFIGMMPQLDSEYMYTFTDTAVNTRLPGTTEVIQTNGIHPTTDGYKQIADAVYREFIATFLE